MFTFLLILFVLACIVLILAVLLQTGKGGLGEIFGGGAERSLFGGAGAGGFIVKVTIGAAIVFVATALILSVMHSRRIRIAPVPQVPVAPVTSPATQTGEAQPAGETAP